MRALPLSIASLSIYREQGLRQKGAGPVWLTLSVIQSKADPRDGKKRGDMHHVAHWDMWLFSLLFSLRRLCHAHIKKNAEKLKIKVLFQSKQFFLLVSFLCRPKWTYV